MSITEKKAKFAASLVKKDKSISKSAVAKAIIKKFKTAMDPVKLREAFIAAGGKVQKRSRTMVKAHKAAMKERKAGKVSATRSPGRRNEDSRREKLMAGMKAMAHNLVVVMHDGVPDVHHFTSQHDAEKFVESMLAKGHTPAQIAFYGREEMSVSVRV